MLFSWIISSLLAGQIAANPPIPRIPPPPTDASSLPSGRGETIPRSAVQVQAGQTSAVPAQAARSRASTAQLVSEALSLPSGSTIVGRDLPLASVVATASTRPQQIEAVHVYWRLAEAVGEYHFCYDRQQRLARLKVRNDEAADLRAVQAVATAEIRDAELRITTAQHDLAETLHLEPGAPLPLPADQPLVGPYRTLYAELFAGKKPPERARMLDQTLPLRNRAIESHAAALLAAEDALDAAIELQTGGQGRLAGVITAMDSQVEQQRAFLAAVCRYNHDIADYVLVAVSPQTSPDVLVGTLIKQSRPAGQAAVPLPTAAEVTPPTATLPASFEQPIAAPAYRGAGVPPARYRGAGVTPAVPNVAAPLGNPNFPMPAAPTRASPRQVSAGTNVDAPPSDAPAVIGPPNVLPAGDPEAAPLAPPQETTIPPPRQSPDATPHTSRKPISESGPLQASPLESFPGLAGLAPAERAVKLTVDLYSQRGRPSSTGQPVRMIDCLRPVAEKRRVLVVNAYWNARQIAAQYESLVQQIQWLEALGPALPAQNPPSPLAIPAFRAARLAVEAKRADSEADSRVAEFELAALCGIAPEKGILQPATAPFVGGYPLPAAGQFANPPDPLTLSHPWSVRRLETTIPRRRQVIIDRAVAVVAADASRAAATAQFLGGRTPVDRILAAIARQGRETSVFLQDVTEYNRAIAEYAMATLPANIEPEKLVAALMVE
jgi:hypothetical protein